MLRLFVAVILSSAAAFADVSPSRRGNVGGNGPGDNPFVSANVHWTLADWLTQKQNMRSQDNWLALHSQTEHVGVSLSGGQVPYTLDAEGVKTTQWMSRAAFGLSYSIFGLQYQYELSNEKFTRQSGQLDLRIFGDSPRTTFWLLSYGIRKWDIDGCSSCAPLTNDESVSNPYASSQLNLYIFKWLGIEGAYQYFFKASDKDDTSYEGHRVEYGPFIDLRVVKAFGKVFSETTRKITSAGADTTDTRYGTEIGAEIGF